MADGPTRPGGRQRPWKVEGVPPDHPAHPDNAGDDDRKRQGFWSTSPSWVRWLLVVLLLLNWLAMTSLLREPERTEIPYSLFWKQVQSGNVDEVTDFTTQRPVFADDNLTEVLIDKGVTVQAEQQTAPLWQQVILGFGPTLLFIALLVWFLRRSTQMAGGGSAFSDVPEPSCTSRSPARAPPSPTSPTSPASTRSRTR